tara:strand:- start:305 stop:637 length:333 start_codon:yes stop_codon:yes gene_type:complete
MLKKKLIFSIIIFSFLMIITSVIKTQTRIIEKNILSSKKKISSLEHHLHEAQLDFFYLSSPEVLTKKIKKFSDEDYFAMDYSHIYHSFDQFLKENIKTTKTYKNEEKFKK